LRREFSEVEWREILDPLTTEQAWLKFKTIFLEAVEKYVPNKRKATNGNTKPLWMTHKAIAAIKKKHRIFKKHQKRDHPACVAASRDASRAIREAKLNYERKLALNIKEDNKSFFAYVHSKSNTKIKPGPIVRKDGCVMDGPRAMVDEFNRYFSSVFTQEDLTNVPVAEALFMGQEEESLTDIVITREMIKGKLEKLRADKAPGEDGMSPKIIRELQDELVDPLYWIFLKSLMTGEVPNDWRTANVTPIYKKGGRSQVDNYRPVSLTSQISKIMESLVRDQVLQFLEANKLIKNSQHGFRKGRSCLTNLLVFLDKVTTDIENGNSVDVIYLDFAKAFDKVPHRRLMDKLRSHGIRGKLWKWIEAWLEGRHQRVCVTGHASDWRPVTSGVPQGSVLGPLLFLIFINDIDSGIINSILKFADDTKIYGAVMDNKDRENLQNDLDNLVKWSEKWQMTFNVEKCKVMHLGKGNRKYSYNMKGQQLEEVAVEKDLGVHVTSDLKASKQCTQAYNKASQMLGMVGRTIKSRSPDILISIYKSIVRPHLEFCSPAWAPHYKKDSELLEKVQHRFTRMFGELRGLEYRERLDKLGLWTLEERRNRADLIEVYRMDKGISCTPLEAMFEKDSDSITRGHSHKLRKRYSKGNTRHFYFSERVVSRWNSLTQEAVDSSSLNAFKGHLTRVRHTRMGFFMDAVR